MDSDGDMIPVREISNIPARHNNQYNPDNDAFAQRSAQQRRTIVKWTRDDLEDKYLRIYEENLLLKKHARKQEDKIKRMATKLLRLVSDKKKVEGDPAGKTGKKGGRDIETEEMLEELHGKIRELEKVNNVLKEKLMVTKQQLATTSKRSTAYGHVQSRIDTGVVKPPGDPRIARSMRVSGPPTARNPPPRYGHSLLEDSRAENKRLEDVIEQLNEELNIYEQEIEGTKEQMRLQEAGHEEIILKFKQQMSQGQRTAIQENIDIIKLQREVKEKSTKITALQGQYTNLKKKKVPTATLR